MSKTKLKKVSWLFMLVVLLLLTSGCIIKFKSEENTTDGGVFKSFDKADSWLQKGLITTVSPEKQSITGVNVYKMIFDPQDHLAIYLATREHGLFYSYDGAASWQRVPQLASGQINSVAVDYSSKCIIYVAQGRKIYKSTDCSRSWTNIHIDERSGQQINDLAVHPEDPAIILGGLATGEIIRSTDYGYSWANFRNFRNPVQKILFDLNNPKIIYVATASAGLYKSIDGGLSWNDVNKGLAEYAGSKNYRNLFFDFSRPDSLVLLSSYGILRSYDGGETWQPLKLLTPPGQTPIYSVAINPQNNQEIYYGTASTLYKSVDGGENWITKRLPTSRAATVLSVDPLTPNVLYLGVTRFGK